MRWPHILHDIAPAKTMLLTRRSVFFRGSEGEPVTRVYGNCRKCGAPDSHIVEGWWTVEDGKLVPLGTEDITGRTD